MQGAILKTPFCEMFGEDCDFQCTTHEQYYTLPVSESKIDYTPPWKDLWSWANLLGIVYLVLALYAVVVEVKKAYEEWKKLKNDPEQRMEGNLWRLSHNVSYQRAPTS